MCCEFMVCRRLALQASSLAVVLHCHSWQYEVSRAMHKQTVPPAALSRCCCCARHGAMLCQSGLSAG